MTEIKSYGRPPTLVEKVMEAVMILRGQEPTWAEAKRQLGKIKYKKCKVTVQNFLDSINFIFEDFMSKTERFDKQ